MQSWQRWAESQPSTAQHHSNSSRKYLSANMETELTVRQQRWTLPCIQRYPRTQICYPRVLVPYQHHLTPKIFSSGSSQQKTRVGGNLHAAEELCEAHLLFWNNWVDICTDGAKSVAGKAIMTFSTVEAVTPTVPAAIVLFTAMCLQGKKCPWRAAKKINFIRFQCLNAHILNLLCAMVWMFVFPQYADVEALIPQSDSIRRWGSLGRV